MHSVKIVAFEGQQASDILQVRHAVFTEEQGIDAELDFDGQDQAAIHALAIQGGRALATGRILNDGHIGRIAVRKDCRQLGLGAEVVMSLVDAARQQHYGRVYLGSQKYAVAFLSKTGVLGIRRVLYGGGNRTPVHGNALIAVTTACSFTH